MTDSQAKPRQPVPARPAAEDEIDLLDYLRIIRRYRGMILVLCCVAMGLAVAVSLLTPRKYQAAVTIVPPLDVLQKDAAGGLGSLSNPLLRQMMDGAAGSITKMYVEILQSREVADTIIDRFDLMETYEGIRYRSDARKRLKDNTKVETTAGGAVKVTVLDRDPNRVAAIAEAYIEELDKRNKKLSAGQATSKRLYLETSLREVEAKLSKIDSIPTRAARTQEMLYDLLLQQYEMAKMEEAKSLPTIQVLDPPIVPERGVPRGTVRKGILAAVAAAMLGIFLAFAREYLVQARWREGEAIPTRQQGSPAPAPAGPLGA